MLNHRDCFSDWVDKNIMASKSYINISTKLRLTPDHDFSTGSKWWVWRSHVWKCHKEYSHRGRDDFRERKYIWRLVDTFSRSTAVLIFQKTTIEFFFSLIQNLNVGKYWEVQVPLTIVVSNTECMFNITPVKRLTYKLLAVLFISSEYCSQNVFD